MKNINYHKILSNYFFVQPFFSDGDIQKKPHIRKCVELPFQQTKAQLWDEVTDTLCNLDLIQAKSAAKMTFELVRDFIDVLDVIPENAENIRNEKARQERMDKYTRDLIAYARGEITKLEIPEAAPLWSIEKADAEIERIKTNPTRLDRLNDFTNFLGQEAGNLQNYAHEFPHFATQQAWNYVDSGTVGKSAEKESPEFYENLVLRSSHTRQPFNPLPQALKTLKGHTDYVSAVSITPDGRRAVSGSNDKTCILWNLKNGEKVARFVSNSGIVAVSCFPSGIFGGESSGNTFTLTVNKVLSCTLKGIVTVRQIWDSELQKFLKPSADCPLCGHRFAPHVSVIATIESITKRANLKPEQSPCLELTDETWEDLGLLGNLPKCGGELKFNPFVARGET